MPGLRVTLLGTGPSQGVPSVGGPDGAGDWGQCDPANPLNRRTRTSAVIERDGFRLLVDAGPDLRQQLLAARVASVDAVLFTHAHADHVMGLDELRQVNRVLGAGLPVFAFPETIAELRARFAYAFRAASPGFPRPVLEPREISPGETLSAGPLDLRVFEQDHRVCRTVGLRIDRFGYSTDVVVLPEQARAALHGLDAWVVGCFRREAHPVHAGLAQVFAWREELRPRRTILTHMGASLDHGALRDELPPGIEPGHDGMVIELT